MRLIDVHSHEHCVTLLYRLLSEREPWQSISHKEMPSKSDHALFVRSRPYLGWWFVEDSGQVVGACYVTKAHEIGIHIFKAHQGYGYGCDAVREVMRMFKGHRLLANINPANQASIALFKSLGFNLIQHTYAHE